jgi:hypothetical protein
MENVYYFSGYNILPYCQKRYVEQVNADTDGYPRDYLVSALTKGKFARKHALRKAKRRERMHLRFLRCY